jgi:hypothetical protein
MDRMTKKQEAKDRRALETLKQLKSVEWLLGAASADYVAEMARKAKVSPCVILHRSIFAMYYLTFTKAKKP